jgi:Flp pilus assembly protein TadD
MQTQGMTAEGSAREYLKTGNILLAAGWFGEALTAFNRAIKIFPNCAASWHGKGQSKFFSVNSFFL